MVDTSAWIDWLNDGPNSAKLADLMPDRDNCIVPTIVQLELYKWLLRETGDEQADRVIAYTLKCVVIALDSTIALRAAEFSRNLKLATADAIVYATAASTGADLLTCDAHLPGFPMWC